MAGLMACNCLDGFYRTHIFGKCWECDEDGLDCKGDYLNLKPGYWWAWQNATHKDRYRNFTSNLNDPVPAYEEGIGQTFMDFTYPMPKPTKCPRERLVAISVGNHKALDRWAQYFIQHRLTLLNSHVAHVWRPC